MKNIFTLNEMENAFEIGAIMMALVSNDRIKIEDSKEAFYCALALAIDFEKEYVDAEDYYNDLDNFVVDKILDRFGNN